MMIGYLKGTIIEKRMPEIWVDVRDVGYRVRVGIKVFERVGVGDAVELYIHTHVREDALELFGFLEREELELFELLLTVSGIGPKIALAIVGRERTTSIERAVRDADVSFFQRIPGLGKKGAQRVIVDLKGKIGSIKELDLGDETEMSDDVSTAFKQFGFSQAEIRAALKEVDTGLSDEEKVREGLKRLGRR